MNFWWVNHKQTFKEEIEGGYIWSPKLKKNGTRNRFYTNMTFVSPGDIIFSYANTKISKIGFIDSKCIDSDRPDIFGDKFVWDKNGYKVLVKWHTLSNPLFPKHFLGLISPLLPIKYAPIQKNGNGNQSCYLAQINEKLACVLFELLGSLGNDISIFYDKYIDKIIANIPIDENSFINDKNISTTEKQSLINSRRGQGKFRENVIFYCGNRCIVTGVTNEKLLIASHIKPWKVSTNKERIDGNNGLLLSPHVDKLFDKGFISFYNSGEMKVHTKVLDILDYWNIDIKKKYGPFTLEQKRYLKYHRKEVFMT